MIVLVLGLVVFLGLHSVRIYAEPWRQGLIARVGENRWKGVYSLLSGVGLALIVWGFDMARQQPLLLWQPPLWTRHFAALLTLIAFWMFTAAYVPRNFLKAAMHDPMILGVKVWALAHLLSNGALHEVVLFGAFLFWAVFDFRAARLRRRATGVAAGNDGNYTAVGTTIMILVGAIAWCAFAFFLHRWLIGVQPIP